MLYFDAGEIDFRKLFERKQTIDSFMIRNSLKMKFNYPSGVDFEKIGKIALIKPQDILSAKKILPNIEKVNIEGSTSVVYKMILQNREVALKIPKNKDVFDFLVELENRKRFYKKELSYFSKTIYIAPDHSYILSEWLSGTYIKDFEQLSKKFYFSLLKKMIVLEDEGVFCWDLNLKNIKYCSLGGAEGMLYDYGDLYSYKEKNVVGFIDDASIFFSNIERIQNCHILRHLSRLERRKKYSVVINNYKNYLMALYSALQYREKVTQESGIKGIRVENNMLSQKILKNILCGKEKLLFADVYIIDKFVCYLTTIEDSIANGIRDESFFLRVREMFFLIRKKRKILDKFYYLYNDSRKLNLSILEECLWQIFMKREEKE